MIVEAHASGRLFDAGDRDQQLEFQVLVALVVDQQLACASEERVVGDVDFDRQSDLLHHFRATVDPELAERHHIGFGAHAHILTHAEKLLAGRVDRRFMTEAIGLQVVKPAALRQRSAFGYSRIERITGRRRQHDVCCFLLQRPVRAFIHAFDEIDVVKLAATEAVHGAGQLREAFHVAAFFEKSAVHAGWKADRFGAVIASGTVDQAFKRLDDIFELAGTSVKTFHAGVDQETGIEKPV